MGSLSFWNSTSILWRFNFIFTWIFFQSILTERSRNNLNIGIQKIIYACKNQSDRNFPSAIYTMGITHSAKMKGTEKFAAIFYLTIYLYTKESNKLFDGCQGSKLSVIGLKKWKNLFQTFLFYHDWIMQKKFSRKDIKEKQMKVINLFRLFKQIVKRTDGSQLKLPKVHELLHSCRDILRHGPARGYDTCPTESNHRPLKIVLKILNVSKVILRNKQLIVYMKTT